MQHPQLLVGIDTGDDAAVYKLADGLAIIQTIDFFPPIVDDPYQFGAISAANSVSDVYAMGGTPLLALNVVCFPEDQPMHVLARILEGGADVAREADMLIVGGHTIKDREPKYGMSVTGLVDPEKVVANVGAVPGDRLVLTKPIGTGIITTALKAGVIGGAPVDAAVASMRRLNRDAADAMRTVGVNAATDVTGFGLVGHLLRMMEGSQTTAHLSVASVPLLDGARDLVEQGVAPSGTRANLDTVGVRVGWHPDVTDEDKLLMCDAQTSGGLLMAVSEDKADHLLRELATRDVPGKVIGVVAGGGSSPIQITP